MKCKLSGFPKICIYKTRKKSPLKKNPPYKTKCCYLQASNSGARLGVCQLVSYTKKKGSAKIANVKNARPFKNFFPTKNLPFV